MATPTIPEILQSGEPLLREVCKAVPEGLFGTPELKEILEKMTNALDAAPDGVALAANQIGIPYRIFIVRFDRTLPQPENAPAREAEVGIFINPQFVNSSRRRIDMDEGCLSVRSIFGTTHRHERTTVRARTFEGKVFERGGGGIVAQIYQHETDHLDGILFVDHAEDLVEVKKKSDKTEDES